MVYEAMHMLAKAIEAGGEATPAAIRDGLRKVEYPSMMGGTISFDDTHQARNNAVVTAFENGAIADRRPVAGLIATI